MQTAIRPNQNIWIVHTPPYAKITKHPLDIFFIVLYILWFSTLTKLWEPRTVRLAGYETQCKVKFEIKKPFWKIVIKQCVSVGHGGTFLHW